ncbi:hypothetical protein [Streptomyces sp. NPDC054940]
MTARAGTGRAFEDVVRARTEADFVERQWLYDRVERGLEAQDGQYVLVTGEPGAGKTSVLAGLARSHPNWLRYFVRQDSRTPLVGGDIQSFLLSTGHQLARLHPEIFRPERLEIVVRQHIETVEAGGLAVGIRIDDLTVSPFCQTAALVLDQEITTVAGAVSAVEINTAGLEPRLLEPDNLAQLALIQPAEVLLREDPSARIVILLDALDELAGKRETATLLEWLAHGPELPPNLSIVMTSRPHSALGPLRSARDGRLSEIAIDPGARQVFDDLLDYADRALGTAPVTTAVTAAGLVPDRFRRDIAHRAAGNFLYLSSYARALADAVERADESQTTRLLGLEGLPQGLAGLYAFFVDSARSHVARLGMVEIRDPLGPEDRLTSPWEGVGRRILAVLTVAREPLTAAKLAELGGIRVWPSTVNEVLARLRWLLAPHSDRFSFYHSSIGEFLGDEQTSRRHPECSVDVLEWHERIVRHYRGTAASWSALDWNTVDRYGLAHLAEHLTRCRAQVANEAADLVCPGLRVAARTTFGSDRHFLRLVDLVADRAVETLPLASGLPTVLYLGVVRRQILRSTRRVNPEILGLMARLGRVEEALEHMSAQAPSLEQVEAMLEILRHAPPGENGPGREELLELLVEKAFAVPPHHAPSGHWSRSLHAAMLTAQELAPHDLRRALRLWDRAREAVQHLCRHDEAPDPIHRAAAVAASDTGEARALIESMHTVRADDYLDLAARAEPEAVPDLLLRAEASLPTDRRARLRLLAVLAVAWAPLVRSEAERLIAVLGAEADRAAEAGAEADHEVVTGLVDAASALAASDRETARHLMERLDATLVNGRGSSLGAAELWADWGRPDRARRLLGRLMETDSLTTRIGVSKVVRGFAPDEALRMLEKARAEIPPATAFHDDMARGDRDRDLQSLALAWADFDLGQAAKVAREIANVWGTGDIPGQFEYITEEDFITKMATAGMTFRGDRHMALAQIAHRHLDAGGTREARELLEEALHFYELAPPLEDEKIPAPYWPAAPDTKRRPLAFLPSLTAMFNLSNEGAARCTQHFHRDPADVIRTTALGPYSWARTVRALAETVADRDLPRAVGLVRSILDGGERAIGLAAVFRTAAEAPYSPAGVRLCEELRDELYEALADLERFEWPHREGARQDLDADQRAWAYLRPDHRTRFEVAVRVFPYLPDTMELLEQNGTTYLAFALQMAMCTWASTKYADMELRGAPPHPELLGIHERTLSPFWLPGNDSMLVDLTRAMATYEDFRADGATGDGGFLPPLVIPKDSVYAGVVDLLASLADDGATRAFANRVRTLLSGERLPAAAGLVAFAAEHLPQDERIRELADDIVSATADRTPATRAVTLAELAVCPALAGAVDPVDLMTQTLRLPVRPTERWVPGEVLAKLFPTLVTRHPAAALRLLYDCLAESWEAAMTQLEYAAAPLIDTLGTDAAELLHGSIRRALECASLDGTVPPAVDGVQMT